MKYAKPKNKIEERVLAWCNRVRAKRGLKPRKNFVKGRAVSNCFECLLAKTIGDNCSIFDDGLYGFGSTHAADCLEMPNYVHKFERNFEEGLYPHLIDN